MTTPPKYHLVTNILPFKLRSNPRWSSSYGRSSQANSCLFLHWIMHIHCPNATVHEATTVALHHLTTTGASLSMLHTLAEEKVCIALQYCKMFTIVHLSHSLALCIVNITADHGPHCPWFTGCIIVLSSWGCGSYSHEPRGLEALS